MIRVITTMAMVMWLAQPGPWRPSFELVQPDVFAASGGQANAWADADGDGDLDYFVAFRGRPNRFYRNDSGVFREIAADVGLADNQETRAAAWGDFDADGDPDLFIGFADPTVPVKVYRNDQNGTRFTNVASAIGVHLRGVARQPAWVDYDGDGDLDLFAAFRDVANTLLRNDGGRFVDVTAASGIGDTRKTVSAVWWDFDRDGDLDLFVANQEGEANGLYRQDRGKFEDVAVAMGVAGTPRPAADGGVGPSVADYDLDGDFDLFVANYGPSALYRNEAGKSFADVAVSSGINLTGHGVTSSWGDLDNDGLADLYVGNFLGGQPLYRDALLMNRGAGGFAEALPEVILKQDATHGVQFVDFDGDGRLDLSLTNNDPNGGGHPLLRNTSATRGRGFFVEVTDEAGRLTRAGSEIRVFQPRTRQLLASALVDAGSGYCSQSAMPSHLGVPDAWKGRVDVEVTTIARGVRRVTSIKSVDPAAHVRRPLRVTTP